jgi:hypothetical protein
MEVGPFWFLILVFIFLERETIVGAVGMWKSRSDFQGQWEDRETVVWFFSLPTARHFHSAAVCFFHALRLRIVAHNWRLAACMSRAASVSD